MTAQSLTALAMEAGKIHTIRDSVDSIGRQVLLEPLGKLGPNDVLIVSVWHG
jgi:hypothetical protein